jgi:hypothetical protein
VGPAGLTVAGAGRSLAVPAPGPALSDGVPKPAGRGTQAVPARAQATASRIGTATGTWRRISAIVTDAPPGR